MTHKLRINFLKRPERTRAPDAPRAGAVRRRLMVILMVFATIGVVFSYHVRTASESVNKLSTFSLVSTIRHLVSSDERGLEGETDDRVNLLLLGIGGEGHDGPQLTDTIIFASVRPSDGAVALMSLPRDMSVPIPNYGYRKVNHANAYGELDNPGSGPELAAQVIGEVLDEDIQYYIRVDFDGFEEFIDAIGGIDVYVETGFTDPSYPVQGKEYDECGYEKTDTTLSEDNTVKMDTSDAEVEAQGDEQQEMLEDSTQEENAVEVTPDYSCRFEYVTFAEGWARMDGKTALTFARSRHGNNGEGSDFARSKRQQKIILAVKDKVLSASTFLNPSRISKMMDALENNVATNLDAWEIVRLAAELRNLDTQEIIHHVIDASPSSPLYATVLNGAYVLLPKNDDWSTLQQIAEFIFTPDSERNTEFAQASEEKPKFVKVEIQNGTNITGLAFRTSQLLDGQGFDVIKIGNAVSRNYEHTVIYDLTNGQRSEELKVLRDYLQADVTLSATGWMLSSEVVPKEITFSSQDYERLATEDDVDFLIILGESASSLARSETAITPETIQ